MTAVPKCSLLVRIVLVAAACPLGAAACGQLDTMRPHDLCNSDSDCKQGHVCLGGICGAPIDGAVSDGGIDRDGVGGEAPVTDPCTATADGPPATAADVPGALIGAWRLCSAATADSRVLWLVAGAGAIQIDETTWQRTTAGGQTDAGASPSGLYFQILEGTNSVFHFIDPDGGGATGDDFSARIFGGSAALELSACDGAGSCTGQANRFARVGPTAPAGG